MKLIRTRGSPGRVFDLVIDPLETHPVERRTAETASEFDRLLADQATRAASFRSRHGRSSPGSITHDDVERLRALGYLPEADGARPESGGAEISPRRESIELPR